MENLRSLANQKIKDYHAEYYRPDNLCIIVAGMVQAEQVFDALEEVELRIVEAAAAAAKTTAKKQEEAALARPWFDPRYKNDALPEGAGADGCVRKSLLFPSDDEEGGGIVQVGWRTQDWGASFDTQSNIDMMWSYLTKVPPQSISIPLLCCTTLPKAK